MSQRMKNTNLSFVVMADPQFGMYADITKSRIQRGIDIGYMNPVLEGFAKETSLFTEAIETSNKINPDFVVICGDMVHNSDSEEQFLELIRISRLLNQDIKLYWVAGNHDVGNKPTQVSLDKYKKQFGEYNYSFQEKNCYFIVLNSCICCEPGLVPDEWNTLISFLEYELRIAASTHQKHKIIFMHHPLFLNDPNEGDSYQVIPLERRAKIIDLITEYDVDVVFTGHLHKNNYQKVGTTELVSTGPVGFPLGDDLSGIRHVEVTEHSLTHKYLTLHIT